MSAAAAPTKKPVSEWTTSDVGLWIRSLDSSGSGKFNHYATAFETARVDGPILLSDVSDPDLEKWITINSHRVRIKSAIEQLKLRASQTQTADSDSKSLNPSPSGGSGGTAVRTAIGGKMQSLYAV